MPLVLISNMIRGVSGLIKIGDRVLSPLGRGTIQEIDGYYIYVLVDTTGSVAVFHPNEVQAYEVDDGGMAYDE